ncbi:MAG TPA: uroporphyrinogen-III synthase [Gammaproteobacteria bacterium]|nr:uroporphyrinogen-III synthase [Gammaproteobacteria bacterium]
MKSDLSSIYVLVTRPGTAGAELCAQIEAQGGRALHFPVIEFAPPHDTESFQQVINQLGEQDWIIFNSPQAVRSAVPAMRKAWPEFPENVQIAAVGSGTAKSLYEAGYISALHPEHEWSSEGLLAMTQFQHVSGKKIVIIRGEGGRQVLEKVLGERGAKVLPCIAYRRMLPTINAEACLKLIHQKELDVIAAGSFESVTNLMLLLGNESWPLLKEIPLIVMSERVKMLAAESGFQTIWVTETASNDAVLDVIVAKICSPG